MQQDLSITIPRQGLIDTLTTKRGELEAEFNATIAEIAAERDGLASTKDALKAWHVEIARLLAEGEIEVSAKGEFKPVGEDSEVPPRPSTNSISASKRDLNGHIKQTEQARDGALANIDAAIRLLNLATDDNVQVPVSQYESMLAGRGTRRQGYYY